MDEVVAADAMPVGGGGGSRSAASELVGAPMEEAAEGTGALGSRDERQRMNMPPMPAAEHTSIVVANAFTTTRHRVCGARDGDDAEATAICVSASAAFGAEAPVGGRAA